MSLNKTAITNQTTFESIATVWLSNIGDIALNCGDLSTDGSSLYSYDTIIGQRWGNSALGIYVVVLLSPKGQSKTTQKHLAAARRVASEFSFDLLEIEGDVDEFTDNLTAAMFNDIDRNVFRMGSVVAFSPNGSSGYIKQSGRSELLTMIYGEEEYEDQE